mgnify:CR=1 FL=1
MLLALLYVGVILAWRLLGQTELAGAWAYRLVDLFSVWFYLPLPLLVLNAIWRRQWRSLAWLAVPCFLFLFDYGMLFLPRGSTEPGLPLRVMTANLLATNTEVGELGQAVVEQDPDVVAVQELSPRLAAALGERLSGDYPYQLLYPSESNPNLGLYSRMPLRPAQGRADGCPCQEATVDLDGQVVTIINAHPNRPRVSFRRVGPLPVPTGFDTSRHDRELRLILARARAVETPVILLGDFNLSDRQRSYLQLRQSLDDAYRAAGWGLGYTFPSENFAQLPSELGALRLPVVPLVRIDYVFYSAGWSAADARVVELPGSDHFSVVADLSLTAAGRPTRQAAGGTTDAVAY